MDKKLEQFIIGYLQDYYNKEIDVNLSEALAIEDDLGIVEEDIDDFLTRFVAAFSLDGSGFDGGRYFTSDSFVFSLLRFFLGQRKWLPLPSDQVEVFTIAHLQRAIDTGKLI